jgi:hypothetical protein
MAENDKKHRSLFDPVKIAEYLFALLIVLVLTVVALGLIPFSHEKITRKVVELVKKNGVESCTIGKVRVTLWKGISLRDVAVAGRMGGTRSFKAKIHSVDIKANVALLWLKSGSIEANIKALRSKERAGRTPPLGEVQALFSTIESLNYVKGITIDGAEVVIDERGKSIVKGSGISCDIYPLADGPASIRGMFEADSAAVAGRTVIKKASCKFSGGANAFAISGGQCGFLDGALQLDGTCNLKKESLSALTITFKNIDLKKVSRLIDLGGGVLAGRADCAFAFDSSAMAIDSLRGKGKFSAADFDIAEFTFQKSLGKMLAYPGVSHLHFKKFRADLTLKPKCTLEHSANGEGDSLNVKAAGWAKTDGMVNEKVECIISRAGVAALPPFAQRTLEETPAGGRVLRFKIYGRIDNPKFEIDSKVILQKAVKNMFDDVRNNLQQWLK